MACYFNFNLYAQIYNALILYSAFIYSSVHHRKIKDDDTTQSHNPLAMSEIFTQNGQLRDRHTHE